MKVKDVKNIIAGMDDEQEVSLEHAPLAEGVTKHDLFRLPFTTNLPEDVLLNMLYLIGHTRNPSLERALPAKEEHDEEDISDRPIKTGVTKHDIFCLPLAEYFSEDQFLGILESVGYTKNSPYDTSLVDRETLDIVFLKIRKELEQDCFVTSKGTPFEAYYIDGELGYSSDAIAKYRIGEETSEWAAKHLENIQWTDFGRELVAKGILPSEEKDS